MMKKIGYIILLIIILTTSLGLSILPIYATTEPTLYERYTSGGDGDSDHIWGSNLSAEQFTTDDTTQGLITAIPHSVIKIRLLLQRYGSPGTVKVSLRTASAGVVNSSNDIVSGTLSGNVFSSTAYTYQEFTMDTETALTTNTQYAIVVTAPDGDVNNYVKWWKDSGGGLANAVGNKSTDGGTTWTSTTPEDYLFQIYGYDTVLAIKSAKQFDSYLVQGDMLFVFEYVNTYPPYYADEADPKRTFYFQLLDTDGSTILAQTVMRAFGDRPGSIYLNENEVTGITSKSGLYIKMIGIDSPYPYVQYQLTSTDWLDDASPFSTHTTDYTQNVYDKFDKDDTSPLDSWVISTANSIDIFEGNTGTDKYTTYIQNKGQVLAKNSQGDSVFINGIPSLNYVRPNIFEVVIVELSIETTTWNNTYNNSDDFESIVGTTISGDMAALGALFGITATSADPSVPNDKAITIAQETMGIVLLIIAALLALFGLFAVGSGFAPISLFIAMPILYWGAQIRAIDIRLIGLIVFILFFIWVRRYIWVEG